MAAFSDYYPVFPNPIWPLFDFQDKKLGYDVTNHLPDPQYMEFSPGEGLAGYYSCEATAAQGINLSKPGDNAPLYLYESTMESSRLQEIINPSMISDEQGASPTFYGPSFGVDHGEPAGLKSTGREEIMGCDANYQLYHTPADGCGMEACLATNNTTSGQMKRRKTDPNVAESVFETNVLVALKVDEKLKSDRCKSRLGSCATKDREEKSNPKLDVIMQDPPELLPSIVMKEPKVESGKDYIHVRAARGQATDRHSLAERVRRRKISDRMNVLQSLVPGCNKITHKALLLEEIIKYVQSLQNQVEILSMELACISPLSAFDHQITGHSFKDSFPVEATPDPVVSYGTAPHYVDHTYTVTQRVTPGAFI